MDHQRQFEMAVIEIGKLARNINLVLDQFQPQLEAAPRLIKETMVAHVAEYAKDALRQFLFADNGQDADRGAEAILASEQKLRDDLDAEDAEEHRKRRQRY